MPLPRAVYGNTLSCGSVHILRKVALSPVRRHTTDPDVLTALEPVRIYATYVPFGSLDEAPWLFR